MPAGSALPLTKRVVEVIADLGEGVRARYRYGSGCLVAGRTVLTAAHVVQDAASVEVRDPDKVVYQAAVDPAFVGAAEGPDLALVELLNPAVDVPAMGLAAVDRDSPGGDPVRGCQAIGYPLFKEADLPGAGQLRETADALGYVPVLSDLVRGLLSLQVREAPRELPAEQVALGKSHWSGMSGGPVVADGLLLGVVSEHAPRAGPSSITVTPLTALEADPEHPDWGPGVPHPAAWWARLGVSGQHELQKLPDTRPRGKKTLPLWLLARPEYLAGREPLLAELETRLPAGGGPKPQVVILHGLGGAGKTSLASEYAHRHVSEVGIAWPFACEDPLAMAAQFGELAAALGVQGRHDTRNPVASVHAALARPAPRWLLIFDNTPDPGTVRDFLPPAGPGRVLITSRNAVWPAERALEVPVLDPEVAAGYLVHRTSEADWPAARALAGKERLDGLPLALEQAAAYIQATGVRLAEYLAAFQQRRTDMLARGDGVTVATTWALAFQELEQSAPGAVAMLRLLAFCAPEDIPLPLLFQPRDGVSERFGPDVAPRLTPLLADSLAVPDAIAALRHYSLIIRVDHDTVSVHRLVQTVTADEMPPRLADQWRRAAAVLIEAAIPEDTARQENWPVCALLLPHAQAALAGESAGLGRLGNYLGQQGSYASARDLYRRHWKALERVLGPGHPDTLRARAAVARWTGQAGDPKGARKQLSELLPMMAHEVGDQSRDTLQVQASLAGWTGEAGDPGAAQHQFAALLPSIAGVFGAEDRETLGARASLARWTGQAGDPIQARKQYEALLPDFRHEFGDMDPETLKIRASLAGWTGDAYDPAGARDAFAGLLPDVARVLGPEHPETLHTRSDLARWTGHAGDAAKARRQFIVLLPDLERVLGSRHPDTLSARANLAYWTGHIGDAAGARDQFKTLFGDTRTVLGADHPETLRARGSIARWTGEAGDPAEARDQFKALRPARVRLLGPRHPDTLATQASIARWGGEAGKAADARNQFRRLQPKIRRVLGPRHPDTLRGRSNVATWTGQAGEAAAARDLFWELLPDVDDVLGPRHPDTLRARAGLSLIHI